MIDIYNSETNELVGTITEADLQVLADHLEEESSEDQDYYIDAATLEMMAEDGAPASLLTFLRRALGNRDGVEIIWSRR